MAGGAGVRELDVIVIGAGMDGTCPAANMIATLVATSLGFIAEV